MTTRVRNALSAATGREVFEKFLDCMEIIHYNVWDYENYF